MQSEHSFVNSFLNQSVSPIEHRELRDRHRDHVGLAARVVDDPLADVLGVGSERAAGLRQPGPRRGGSSGTDARGDLDAGVGRRLELRLQRGRRDAGDRDVVGLLGDRLVIAPARALARVLVDLRVELPAERVGGPLHGRRVARARGQLALQPDDLLALRRSLLERLGELDVRGRRRRRRLDRRPFSSAGCLPPDVLEPEPALSSSSSSPQAATESTAPRQSNNSTVTTSWTPSSKD